MVMETKDTETHKIYISNLNKHDFTTLYYFMAFSICNRALCIQIKIEIKTENVFRCLQF